MKPTITLQGKNPQLATYAHLLALLGGVLAIVFGILGLLNLFNALSGILTGLFIVVVEIDRVDIPFLKDAMIRGIVWIILGYVASGVGWASSLLTLIAGVLYLVYNYS